MKSLLVVLLTLSASTALAQFLNPIVDSIPARDGKMLAVDIYVPDTSQTWPTILIQTPYNRQAYRWKLPLGIDTSLSSSNYAFVVLDWRCFYGSTGACIASPQRGEDGYDAVEWIASQPWSDGKVGTWGPSALGKIQYQTAREQPPSLVCGVPLVAGSQFNYEEYFPGGVARTEYIEQLDALGFGLSTLLYANPVYNAVWQFAEAGSLYPQDIQVPMFMIGGWYDHNVKVMIDLFDTLRVASPASVRDKHRLLMGPWAHGGSGSAYVGSAQQGELSFPDAEGWSDSLAVVFFDHHLRGQSNGWDTTDHVTYFQMGEDEWRTSDTWPPGDETEEIFLVCYTGSLSQGGNFLCDAVGNDQFQYDPNDPSPTHGGPTLRSDQDQGPYDQSDTVEGRNDIVSYTTDVHPQNMIIRGRPIVTLTVQSDQLDTDFAVRLTDVYPDGRSMLLSDGIRRMRFRNGYSATDTALVTPGWHVVTIELPDIAHTIVPGHRLRLIVSSSNYPRFNRNMNNGNTMYPAGNGDTLINPQIATNRVQYALGSDILLPMKDHVPITGIQSVEVSGALIITPNPTSSDVTIMAPTGGRLIVLDMLGRVISDREVKTGFTRVSGLEPGIYLIRLASERAVYQSKVIVTK
jgi:predicted acyl esterase